MAKTKIKQDTHGLYVRANGAVFRPERSRYAYNPRLQDGESAFSVGFEVGVYHPSGTAYLSVKKDGVSEYWSHHGSYFANDGKVIKSDLVWAPQSQETRAKISLPVKIVVPAAQPMEERLADVLRRLATGVFRASEEFYIDGSILQGCWAELHRLVVEAGQVLSDYEEKKRG